MADAPSDTGNPPSSGAGQIEGVGTRRVLKPGPGRWIGVAVVAGLFVAIGLYLVAERGSWIGWLSLVFFGFVLAVALAQLLGIGSRLILDQDTFETSNFGRRTAERWDEVHGFMAFRQSYNNLIGFDRVRDQESGLAAMNRKLTGRSAAFPETFGLDPDELVRLLEAYRENGVARSWALCRDTVADTAATLRAELERSGRAASILTDPDMIRQAVPDDATPWPSLLVIDETAKRDDGGPKILTAIDVLNPETRWLKREMKERSAFANMGSEEFWTIDPATGTEQRMARRDRSTVRPAEPKA